jgi:hypothetical protein
MLHIVPDHFFNLHSEVTAVVEVVCSHSDIHRIWFQNFLE